MDKNSKTDKIFFNNPTNYTAPEKLLVFDTRAPQDQYNLSTTLVRNLQSKQNGKKTEVDPSSKYHSMSEVVNMNKTLKPSLYHDLDALEMDFSFPEDKPKTPPKKVYHKLHNGAEQIDEFTFRIGGIEFKDYRGKSNTKSATNLLTSSNTKSATNLIKPKELSTIGQTSSRSQGLTKGETQYKSFTNLPSRNLNQQSLINRQSK